MTSTDPHDLSKLEAGDTNNTNTSDSSKPQDDQNYYLNYGPLAHVNTAETRLPPFGGEFQPGLYRPVAERKLANPAPLGLCGFALTTFVLGMINMQARGITEPNMVVGPAFVYGGFIQILSGMWYVSFAPYSIAYSDQSSREMAVGNTFGATALTSYGGFWISLAITFTPGGFQIQKSLEAADPNGGLGMFYDSLGIFLMVRTRGPDDQISITHCLSCRVGSFSPSSCYSAQ